MRNNKKKKKRKKNSYDAITNAILDMTRSGSLTVRQQQQQQLLGLLRALFNCGFKC